MKYSLCKDGKFGLYTWTFLFFVFVLLISGGIIYAVVQKGSGLESILRVILADIAVGIVSFAVFQHEKKKIDAYFTLDHEKLTMCFSEEEKIDFFWSEILFSGICIRTQHYNNRYNRIEKLICFSKVWLTEEMKQSLKCGADENIVCIQYDKALVDVIRQYYDISPEPIDITRNDFHMYDE